MTWMGRPSQMEQTKRAPDPGQVDYLSVLMTTLGRRYGFSQVTQAQDFLILRQYCDFEGHGSVSETWEEHIALLLPLERFHWKSAQGWQLGPSTAIHGMRFHGRTASEVIHQALNYLQEVPYRRKVNENYGLSSTS